MFPDIKTIFLCYVLTGLLCTLFMVFLWYRNRRRFSGLSLWIVNFVCQVLSLILILMRGVLSEFITIVVANGFMAFGTLAMLFGLERFLGKRISWKYNIIFLTAFILAHAYFTYMMPDLQARVINLSLIMLLLTTQCTWLLARGVDRAMVPITRGTAIVMGLYGGIAIFRIIHALSWTNTKQSLFHTSIFDASLILAYTMLFIGLTYSLAMMVNRRLNQEFQTQEERFRSMVELSADWLYWISPDGTLLYSTPSCEPLTGYGPQEFISDPDMRTKIVHPDDRDAVREHSHAAAKSIETLSMDCRIVTPTGEIRWINHVCQAVYDLDNRWLGQVVSNRDITRRKKMEQELVKAREDWEGIFHATGDFTLILSPDQEIQAVNRMGEKLLGRPARELVGKRCYELFHESGAPPEGCPFSTIRGNSSVTSAEMTVEALNRIFMVSCTPVLDADGRVEKVIHVATDITERKGMEAEREKLQLQFLQAQKMESVGRLAGGVAHDFNNMLGVILGRAELALMQMDPKNPFHEDFKEIEKTARRSADLTRQLLAFARKQTISPKVLNLNIIVEKMLKMLRSLIGEDIDLLWMPQTNLWPVRMDPAQVDQIMANLCVNARDAISGVGKISIKTKNTILERAGCIDRAEFVPGEYVTVDVTDNGSGMTEEMISNIFEPFFTTKGVGEGTGLGLSTVYGIVKQNNGFIDVISESGQGTTFSVYIPRYTGESVKEIMEAPAEPPRGNGETVLLVEDDPGILELSGNMLERLGYNVLRADSPNGALELAQSKSEKINLLMTDVVMPGMNGNDLAKRLCEMQSGIKVLFMSGYTADIIAHQGILDQDTHFIQKPFAMMSLARGIRDALTGKVKI